MRTSFQGQSECSERAALWKSQRFCACEVAGDRCWSISMEQPLWLGVRGCCSRTLAMSCPLWLLYKLMAAGGAVPCQLCSGFPGFWFSALCLALFLKHRDKGPELPLPSSSSSEGLDTFPSSSCSVAVLFSCGTLALPPRCILITMQSPCKCPVMFQLWEQLFSLLIDNWASTTALVCYCKGECICR